MSGGRSSVVSLSPSYIYIRMDPTSGVIHSLRISLLHWQRAFSIICVDAVFCTGSVRWCCYDNSYLVVCIWRYPLAMVLHMRTSKPLMAKEPKPSVQLPLPWLVLEGSPEIVENRCPGDQLISEAFAEPLEAQHSGKCEHILFLK